jgi:cbb3-type cytochrome oxidase subunit 1
MYLSGMFIMAWNAYKTLASGKAVAVPVMPAGFVSHATPALGAI